MRLFGRLFLAPAAMVMALIVACPANAQDPDALWKIVHNLCVPHQERFGTPLPCAEVSRDHSILKDIRGASQFLLIPTARISGIDDPLILMPAAPNYWQPAWDATRLVQALVNRPLPRDAMSLAINSAVTRTQNQLHIHVDCVRTDVRDALRMHRAKIGKTWTKFPEPLAGHTYYAMRLDTLVQPGGSPFQLLPGLLPPGANMAMESLVVVGATFDDGAAGFILLETREGGGEELQDHACTIATTLPPQ